MITKHLIIILVLILIVLAIPVKLNNITDHYNLERQDSKRKIIELGYRIVTAYSSSPDETDSTPFITASNQKVRRGIIATNELPMGTKITISGLENSCVSDITVFEVQDRTNRRYNYRIDIWCESKEEALEIGRQTRLIEIVKEN